MQVTVTATTTAAATLKLTATTVTSITVTALGILWSQQHQFAAAATDHLQPSIAAEVRTETALAENATEAAAETKAIVVAVLADGYQTAASFRAAMLLLL